MGLPFQVSNIYEILSKPVSTASLSKVHQMSQQKQYAGFGKKYIGSYAGRDTDNHTGSGVEFRKDFRTYGSRAFSRTILEYIEDVSDLAEAEKAWLTRVDAKRNPLYYNKTNGSSAVRKPKELDQVRKLCGVCHTTPVAINYTDPQGRTHYRSRCENCTRKDKKLPKRKPRWAQAGYRKKMTCDRCGFRAKYSAQTLVYHADGNLNNCEVKNLKTVCRNCEIDLSKSESVWRPGDLQPDV
jgi:hypothetical protein